MYAIVEQGAKQYKLEVGDEVLVEKIEGKPGDKVELDKVVFLKGAGEVVFEEETLKEAKVKATIVEQTKDKKIIVFKYKPKKNYRRKRGHRQRLTRLKIDEIVGLKEEKPKVTRAVKKAEPKETAAKKVAKTTTPKKPAPKKTAAKD